MKMHLYRCEIIGLAGFGDSENLELYVVGFSPVDRCADQV